MSKKISAVIAVCLFINSFGVAQSSYIPPKPAETPDEDYRTGKYILINSRAQIKGKVFAIDYWNFAIAYAKMGQSQDSILFLLQRAKAISEEDFCELVYKTANRAKPNESFFYKKLGQHYQNITSSCAYIKTTEPNFDLAQYIKENNYNPELITSLDRIMTLDQKHRSPSYNATLQEPIDLENQKEVETIINKWGYPGRSLVGSHYESTCWAVVQHAPLNYQEKYLPLIHKAVIENELNDVPLKMLIDRIYMKKTQTQIFGSQMGIKFADDKTIEEVKRKYGFK